MHDCLTLAPSGPGVPEMPLGPLRPFDPGSPLSPGVPRSPLDKEEGISVVFINHATLHKDWTKYSMKDGPVPNVYHCLSKN